MAPPSRRTVSPGATLPQLIWLSSLQAVSQDAPSRSLPARETYQTLPDDAAVGLAVGVAVLLALAVGLAVAVALGVVLAVPLAVTLAVTLAVIVGMKVVVA